jgi:hypothetical protein
MDSYEHTYLGKKIRIGIQVNSDAVSALVEILAGRSKKLFLDEKDALCRLISFSLIP